MNHPRRSTLPLVLLLLAACLCTPILAQPPTASVRDPRRTPIVEVYEQYKDSVVYLSGPTASGANVLMDEFFKLPKNREIVSIGSGFLIHPSGYIVTNAHAVEKVVFPQAMLSSGQGYQAELIGMARDKDLALLKVEPGRPLRAVQLAKSHDTLIGETVIVIGNPVGLRDTCTAGVLSATGRIAQSHHQPGITLRDLLQSDASINPGSSGGPWFNVLGQVIGVTTATKVGSQNIGFGVPVASLREILPELLDVQRRYGLTTGIEFAPHEPCVVMKVAADSPAARAGIQPGDILVKCGDRPLAGRCDFDLALVGRKPGETLKTQVWRNQRLYEAAVVLAARPKPDGAAILSERYGLGVVPLDEERARVWSLRVHRGVVIAAVASGPPYDKLENPPLPGDVLARINDIRPRDLDHVGLLLDRVKPGEAVRLVLLRMKSGAAIRVDLTLTLSK